MKKIHLIPVSCQWQATFVTAEGKIFQTLEPNKQQAVLKLILLNPLLFEIEVVEGESNQ